MGGDCKELVGHFSPPSLWSAAENRAQQSVIHRTLLASVGRTVPWLTMAAMGGDTTGLGTVSVEVGEAYILVLRLSQPGL